MKKEEYLELINENVEYNKKRTEQYERDYRRWRRNMAIKRWTAIVMIVGSVVLVFINPFHDFAISCRVGAVACVIAAMVVLINSPAPYMPFPVFPPHPSIVDNEDE